MRRRGWIGSADSFKGVTRGLTPEERARPNRVPGKVPGRLKDRCQSAAREPARHYPTVFQQGNCSDPRRVASPDRGRDPIVGDAPDVRPHRTWKFRNGLVTDLGARMLRNRPLEITLGEIIAGGHRGGNRPIKVIIDILRCEIDGDRSRGNHPGRAGRMRMVAMQWIGAALLPAATGEEIGVPWTSDHHPTDLPRRHVREIADGRVEYVVVQGGTMDGRNGRPPRGGLGTVRADLGVEPLGPEGERRDASPNVSPRSPRPPESRSPFPGHGTQSCDRLKATNASPALVPGLPAPPAAMTTYCRPFT